MAKTDLERLAALDRAVAAAQAERDRDLATLAALKSKLGVE